MISHQRNKPSRVVYQRWGQRDFLFQYHCKDPHEFTLTWSWRSWVFDITSRPEADVCLSFRHEQLESLVSLVCPLNSTFADYHCNHITWSICFVIQWFTFTQKEADISTLPKVRGRFGPVWASLIDADRRIELTSPPRSAAASWNSDCHKLFNEASGHSGMEALWNPFITNQTNKMLSRNYRYKKLTSDTTMSLKCSINLE